MRPNALFVSSGAAALLFASLALAKQPMVDVCHKGKTIEVAVRVAPKHVEHGDTACACEVIDDCAAQGGELDTETCECRIEPPGCAPEVVAECDAQGGVLDSETCECQVDSFACEAAGICDDIGYEFGCNGNPDCACGTDTAGDGVCVAPLGLLCEDMAPCPNGQSDCPDGTVCVVATCCGPDAGIPDVCVPLCPPTP